MVIALDAPQKPTREFAIECLTGVLREAAGSLPEEIANLSLDELEQMRKPTEIDYFLRKNLWKQVELVKTGVISSIEPIRIYQGVCTRANYEKLIKNHVRIAWLLVHPGEDMERAEMGFSIGLKNLIKFVSKEPDQFTASAFLKAMEMLWNRVHGPVPTKIDARHAHVNLNKPIAPNGVTPQSSIEQLNRLRNQLSGQERDVSETGSIDAGGTGEAGVRTQG